MNTSHATRSPLLRRHTEIIGGALVAVLFAFAYWLSGPTLVYLLPFAYDGYDGVEFAAGMIPYMLMVAVAAVVAFTSVSIVARCLSWVVMLIAWIAAFYSYFAYAWEGSDLEWLETTAEILIVVWQAALPAIFLLVCWKLPRPRFDTYFAEAILLLFIVISLGFYTNGKISDGYEVEGVPLEPIVVYVGVAAYFGLAAWLVPTRRIFYGVTALAGLAVAACGKFVFTTDILNTTGDEFLPIHLFKILAIGIPAIGLVLQIVWHVRGKARGEVRADAASAA